MANGLKSRLIFIALLLFGGFVFLALQPRAFASETATRFICAARVDCGAGHLLSTQDLPSESTPVVVARSAEGARSKCISDHTSAYLRLAKSADEITPAATLSASRGCKIVSEAFPE